MHPQPGKVDESTATIARLSWDRNGGSLRTAFTYVDLDMAFEPNAPAIDLTRSNGLIPIGSAITTDAPIGYQAYLFSAEYNHNNWQITLEWNRNRVAAHPFILGGAKAIGYGEGYYLQASYNFKTNLKGFVRYDVLYRIRDDKDGKRQARSEIPDQFKEPASRLFAKDWTTGLRWDITNRWMAAAEVHIVEGTAWLSPFENDFSATSLEEDWHMFNLLTAYRF